MKDEKIVKFELIKKAMDQEREVYIESISMCFDLMEKAYERLFKLQSTLGTFGLVGIFTLISWGKLEFFYFHDLPTTKLWIYLSVALHVTSLILLTILNNFSVQIQFWKQELHKEEYKIRSTLLVQKNTLLPESTVYLSPTEEDAALIEKSLKPFITKIEELAPKTYKISNFANYVFYASAISTLGLVMYSLKV